MIWQLEDFGLDYRLNGAQFWVYNHAIMARNLCLKKLPQSQAVEDIVDDQGQSKKGVH